MPAQVAAPSRPGGQEVLPTTPAAIGLTTQVIRQAKWYKHLGRFGLKTVEINRQNSKLHFNHFFLEKVKGYLEGYDVSIHSGTSGIFQPQEVFTQAYLAMLTAELEVCRIIGARQLVFHLRDGYLAPHEKKSLGGVIGRASDLGVELFYESNSTLVADQARDILNSFPSLGYVLDLGHLNHSLVSGRLGCPVDEFLAQVRPRVTYLHASNNFGLRDDHNGLDRGTLDWRGVLDALDLSRVCKIIVEVRQADMVGESVAALRRYLAGGLAPSAPCPGGRPLPPDCLGNLEGRQMNGQSPRLQ